MKQERKAKLLMGAVATAMGIAGLSSTSHSAMGQITFTTTPLSFNGGTPPVVAVLTYNGGTQIAAYSTAGGLDTPLIWSPGNSTPTALPLLPGYNNADGKFTTGTYQGGVMYNASNSNIAVLWNGPSSTPVNLNPSGAKSSNLNSISSDGSEQAGTYVSGIGAAANHAIVWKGTAASYVDLNPIGSSASQVIANIDGQQAGNFQPGANIFAAIWSGTAASVVNLHPSAAKSSGVQGTAGSQQVGYASYTVGGQLGAIWYGSAASYVNLNTSGFTTISPVATNGSQQVGYATPTGGVANAMLWNGTAGSYTNLGALLGSGFTKSYAQKIVGNTVYGVATNASGGAIRRNLDNSCRISDLEQQWNYRFNGSNQQHQHDR